MDTPHPPPEPPNPIPLTFRNPAELEPYLPPKSANKEALYPHVTLTYAQSLDGQISLQAGAPTVLSGPESKAMTHFLRSRHDAIMVGVGTAKADNPGLNTRYSEDRIKVVGLERQPRPFVLDPSGRWGVEDTPKLFALAEDGAGRAPGWVVGAGVGSAVMRGKVRDGKGVVVDVGEYGGKVEGVDWDVVLRGLKRAGIGSVMIEGGGAVIEDLLRKRNHKFISSVIVTIAPTYLGAGGVHVAPRRSKEMENEVRLKDIKWIPLSQDVVMAGFIND